MNRRYLFLWPVVIATAVLWILLGGSKGAVLLLAFGVGAEGAALFHLWRKKWVQKGTEPVATESVSAPSPSEMVQYPCGHEGLRRFSLEILPEKLKEVEGVKLCLACAQEYCNKHIVACGRCGEPILPADGVALYHGKPEKGGERVARVDGGFLGCLRWDCCPTGGLFAGHWSEQGFRSAFAGGTAAGEVMRTGKSVSGTTDYPRA